MAPTPVVMTTKPLYLQNATNYAALDLRGHLDASFAEGVDGQAALSVSQRAAGTNMSVDVAAGTASIDGDSPSGSRQYMIRADALTNVTLEAAPGSNSRIDLIVATVRDAAVGGGANNDWVLTAVTGTSGASPSPPALPTSSIELARVLVASGTSAITNAMITDRRKDMHRVGWYFNYQPAQVTDGHLVSDYSTNRLYQGRGGSWVNVLQGVPVNNVIGGTIIGGTPPATAVFRSESGEHSVSFTAGEGKIQLTDFAGHVTFNGITDVYAIAIGNSKAIAISRRTSGGSTPIDGDHVPLSAYAVSNAGGDAVNGGITVNWKISGW